MKNNREFASCAVEARGIGAGDRDLLYDPQTSGGLLISLPERMRPRSKALTGAYRIGRVVERAREADPASMTE